ncbi:hypothetical protein [Phyllobacterium salinisoli]|uniref:hypothetical protein n=1 Tax=Phyllobacterium salinisoli TaxID=1899321 RepID=UPI0011C02F8C|nr:hypothetical protein [Phyllobacterium salinisoli]
MAEHLDPDPGRPSLLQPLVIDWCRANDVDFILGVVSTTTLRKHVADTPSNTMAKRACHQPTAMPAMSSTIVATIEERNSVCSAIEGENQQQKQVCARHREAINWRIGVLYSPENGKHNCPCKIGAMAPLFCSLCQLICWVPLFVDLVRKAYAPETGHRERNLEARRRMKR